VTIEQLVGVLASNGLSVALVVFWAWKAADRENLLNERIQRLEETVSGSLQTQLKESTLAILKVTEALGRHEDVVEEVLTELRATRASNERNAR
jgi:hypothetical protein